AASGPIEQPPRPAQPAAARRLVAVRVVMKGAEIGCGHCRPTQISGFLVAAERRLPLGLGLGEVLTSEGQAAEDHPGEWNVAGLCDLLPLSFDALLRPVYLPRGHTFASVDLAGASMWTPTGKSKLSVLQQGRLAPLMIRLMTGANLRNGARLNVQVERAHPVD